MVRIVWIFGKNCSSHPYHCFSIHFLSVSKEFELNLEFEWMGDIYLNAWRQFKFDPPRSNRTTMDLTRISDPLPPPKKKSWCKNKIFVQRKSKSYIENYGYFSHSVDLGSVIRRNQTAYFGDCKLKYSINLDFIFKSCSFIVSIHSFIGTIHLSCNSNLL